MKIKDVVKTLKELGWLPKLNLSRYAEKALSDRTANFSFRLNDLTVYQTFRANFSIKSKEFTRAVKTIEGRAEFNDLLKIDFHESLYFEEVEITKKHIEIACERAIAWATCIDIDERYTELCEIDPSTPGAAGVWHLAALALKGRVDRLAAYQSRFETGDNCGFVNFITKDYIDRAVKLAAEA